MEIMDFFRAAPDPTRQAEPHAYVESSKGRLRDECLDEHWFLHLLHARVALKLGIGNTTRSG